MEYLEGQTTAERLLKGPLPLPEVLRYGVECDFWEPFFLGSISGSVPASQP